MGVATLETEARERQSSLPENAVVGDYRIDGVIGTGGMATVYRATQTMIGKRVAIKVLHRTKSDTAVSRFVKEARAVNVIGHPNIVDVFGFGMTESGRPYLVMELLEGETVAVRAERQPLTIAEVAEIIIEVSLALEAAHDAGIVHRDLKPENIFITRRNHVKLLDFGIAKIFGDGDLGTTNDDTRPGVLLGTPRYISPEQVRGAQLDGRVDIYSLGVVAFELLARHALFTASNAYDLFQKHAKLRPPKPSSFNASLPPEVDALLGEMLAKEPNERPTLAQIRERLERLRDATPVPVKRAVSQATDVQPIIRERQDTNVIATATDHDPTTASRGFAKRWVVGGMLVGALVGAVSAVLLTQKADPTTPFVVPTMPAVPAVVQAPRAVEPVVEAEPAPAPETIEIDPVTHAATPVKKSKPKKVVVAKPHAPQAAPAKTDDDVDAVRSPFEHKP
jgi:eukaryotic-like serine/threonine-protein kinase